jgi:DNA-binding MarR family transcriptional regulator
MNQYDTRRQKAADSLSRLAPVKQTILAVAASRGPCSGVEILTPTMEQHSSLSRPTARRRLDALVSEGLIQKSRYLTNQNCKRYQVTTAGLTQLRQSSRFRLSEAAGSLCVEEVESA